MMITYHILPARKGIRNNNFVMLLCLTLVLGCLFSCKDYLDVKPDKSMVLPATLEDCQALLDNYGVMNTNYPSGAASADNYFLNTVSYNAQTTINKDGYTWKPEAEVNTTFWSGSYQRILYANQVLKTLGEINPNGGNQAQWNQIKGSALFYRAFNYFEMAGVFIQPYDAATPGEFPGLPLRLSPDISQVVGRGTVQQTYDQILQDLNEAVKLLPAEAPTSTIKKARPGLTAVHGLLARVYLAMRAYPDALVHSNESLKIYSILTNYNTLDSNAATPFLTFHAEVIFNASGSTSNPLNPFYANITPALYASYHSSDLRRAMFFKLKPATTFFQFKGSYFGGVFAVFSGLATDEQYLIRAECYARKGDIGPAMADLNALMAMRWKGTYTNRSATSADDALVQVLTERRKELLYRPLRWTDLRRLNKEPRFSVTLSRDINGTVFTLPPNDLRYTLLLPLEVLRREDIPQNAR